MSAQSAPRARALLLGLLLCAQLPACGGIRSPLAPRVSEEERRAYAGAQARAAESPAAGERAFAAFLDAHAESALADEAAVRRAELARARGDEKEALRRFRYVLARYPGSEGADLSRVGIAELELAQGRPGAAEAALRGTRLGRLPPEQAAAAYRVLADVSQDPAQRLGWLARLRPLATDEDARALLDVEIDALAQRLDAPTLARVADELGRDELAGRLWLRSAELALGAGDLSAARDAVEEAQRAELGERDRARVAGLEQRVLLRERGPAPDVPVPSFSEVAGLGPPDTSGARGVLGVVLPLSGRFARFGEESLRGVLLAAGVFGAGGAQVRVAVRDSAGRPEQAAAAVRELADAGVVAVVGPLLSGESEAAAAVAEAAGLPLLALTGREEVSATRPHVFRVRTQPVEEVAALVEHAFAALGARRFAILYPRDSYGRGLRELFWNAVERRGGELVAVASYDPDATDFADPIRKLLGYSLLGAGEQAVLRQRAALEKRARRLPPRDAAALRAEARALTGPDGAPLPPIVDFEALFIPEAAEKVVLIAPQLAFHEAVGMTLLGPNGWHHPDLVPIGQKHVEGALFTAHFHAESELPGVRSFRAGYQRAYAEAPDAFAAQAFDAANLVLLQLARGRSSREAVREGVLGVRGYPGVTGVLSMRADGNARKRPFLLEVDGGRIGAVE